MNNGPFSRMRMTKIPLIKRDMTIIDRKVEIVKTTNKHLVDGYQMDRKKYYKYQRNVCG